MFAIGSCGAPAYEAKARVYGLRCFRFARCTQYHEAESPMLRDRFAAAVEAAVAEVEKRPNAYPVVTGKFRRVPVLGFRYGVYYRILASLILVSAVYHASREYRFAS